MAQSSTEKTMPKITVFTVHIPDNDLQHLDTLLRITPIAQSTSRAV